MKQITWARDGAPQATSFLAFKKLLLTLAVVVGVLFWAGNSMLAGAVTSITSISPVSGPVTGGTAVMVDGSGFMKSVSWKQLGPGDYHTCALAEDDWVYCWGANWLGQLGAGVDDYSLVSPIAIDRGEIPDGVTIKQIESGNEHSCVLASNNKIYCWGDGEYGQLGNGELEQSNIPVEVLQGAMLSDEVITDIDLGHIHSCLATESNNIYCWGYNYSGGLGDGSFDNSSVPVAVQQGELPLDFEVRQLTSGGNNSCVLTEAGWVYCWGEGGGRTLGNGATIDSATPVAIVRGDISDTENIIYQATNNLGSCVVSDIGKVYCWGYNSSGQLGDGTNVHSSMPVAVLDGSMPADTSIVKVAAGGSHACALDETGRAYCWGNNFNGQLGDGTMTNSSIPVNVVSGEVPTGTIFDSLVGTEYGTCSLSTEGVIYCWGYNSFGQLGNGGSEYRITAPVGMDLDRLPKVPSVDSVLFGSLPALSFSVESDTRLTAVSPAQNTGAVDVIVTGDDGTSISYSSYTYTKSAAPKITIDKPSNYTVGSNSPALTGTVDDPEASIVVKVLGVSYQAINNRDGTWILPEGSINGLAAGDYNIEIVVTDSEGGSSTLGAKIVVLQGADQSSGDELAETGYNLYVVVLLSLLTIMSSVVIFRMR